MGCDLLFQGTFGPLNTRFQSFQPILHAGFAGFTRWMVDLTRSAGGRHLLKFTLLTPFLHTFSSLSYSWAPTPVHWCTIWGSYYWNFRLEFVMCYTSQHTSMIAISSLDSFCSRVYMYVYGMSSKGIIRNLGLFFEMGLIDLYPFHTTSHANVTVLLFRYLKSDLITLMQKRLYQPNMF